MRNRVTMRFVISLFFAALLLTLATGAVYADDTRTITVTALTQEQNPKAQGSELWIKSLVIDGEETAPEEAFSDGWIEEEGYLKWKEYDRPEWLKDSITATVPADAEVYVVFQSNIWRGVAQVKDGKAIYRVDCYGEYEDGEHVIRSDTQPVQYVTKEHFLSDLRVSGRTMNIAVFSVLILLAGIFCLVDRRKAKTAALGAEREGSAPRELWLDVLKVISAPLIVLIHTVGSGYSGTPVGDGKWLGYLVLNTLPRCAVPVFIMVSGALLLGKEMPLKKAWRKAKKAIVLLIVWNLTYILAQALLWGPSEPIWKQVLSLPVQRGPSGHLWYAYFLVWMYLFSPVIGALYQALSGKKRVYFVLITVVVPGLLDLYIKAADISTSTPMPAYSMYMALPYIGMMFMGRMIYERAHNGAGLAVYAALSALGGLLVMLAVTYFYVKGHGAATDQFMSETQLLAVCYGAGVMGLAASTRAVFGRWPEKLRRCVVYISQCSLGIYFIHQLFIWTVGDIRLGAHYITTMDRPVEALALAVVYYVLGLAAAALMAKIPLLKKLVM